MPSPKENAYIPHVDLTEQDQEKIKRDIHYAALHCLYALRERDRIKAAQILPDLKSAKEYLLEHGILIDDNDYKMLKAAIKRGAGIIS